MKRPSQHGSRHRLVASAAVLAVSAMAASVAPAQQGEFVVSSQVVSDEVTVPAGGHVEGVVDGGVISQGGGDCVSGNCGGATVNGGGGGVAQRRDYGQPDLFYNYYTQGQANAANAQMYVSPVPVPAFVGHTFGTYQPWYPHHYLYWHKDRYHNYYDDGRGMNRTRAVYYSPPVRQAASNFYWNVLRIPR